MSDENKLEATPAVLSMTIQVTRKTTGKVETYEVVGTPLPLTPEPEPKPEGEL